MLRRVALVGTDVSEERIASIFRVKGIGELGTTLTISSNRSTLRGSLRSVLRLLVNTNVVPSSPIPVTLIREAISSSETPVLTSVIRRNLTEDGILQGVLVLWEFIWRAQKSFVIG
jgi:hypothetical protein